MLFSFRCLLMTAAMLLTFSNASAATYPLLPNSDVVGELQTGTLNGGQTLNAFAQSYDIGYYELLEANPHLNPLKAMAGSRVVIPTRYVLPNAPHQGIIINLAELRLYYFPPAENIVITEPIGIGRQGWDTPEGTFTIKEKIEDPTWHVPASIAADMASQGIILPKEIGPGPDNPLGRFAMRLSLPNYLIHSTNRPEGVGLRASAGCIRMYPESIEKLFPLIAIGTPVTIVNQPYKTGWSDGELFLEAHQPLKEQRNQFNGNLSSLWVDSIDKITANQPADLQWKKVAEVAHQQTGIPTVIGKMSSSAPPEKKWYEKIIKR